MIPTLLHGDDSQFDERPIRYNTKLPTIPEVGQQIFLEWRACRVKVLNVVWVLNDMDVFSLDVEVTSVK